MQPNTHSFGNLDNLPESDFDPFPVDNYQLICNEMEMKDTRAGTGSYLACGYTVQGPSHEGRRVWHNFNLVNQNAQAVEIALREIKTWLEACGLPSGGELTMDRIKQLEGKKFWAKVGIEKDKSGQYPDKNRISRFLPAPGSTNGAPPPQGDWAMAGDALPENMGKPPASTGKRPWEQ